MFNHNILGFVKAKEIPQTKFLFYGFFVAGQNLMALICREEAQDFEAKLDLFSRIFDKITIKCG